jgi:lysophospholipid acyltransferase (LPLAT)-like uncharacterized protein
VPKPSDQLYRFAPLTEYSLWQRISIRIADLSFYVCIKLVGLTTRFETRGAERLEAIESNGKLPIVCFWHNRIFLGTYFWRDRGVVVLTSKSYDGEYIARFIQRFGFGAIRGSSSRGGAAALIQMVRSMRDGHPMAFSVDGPRGPKYKAKQGAVLLAKKTGEPMLPFIVEPRRYWQLKSWDNMQIPMPFTRALAIFGEPIYVNPTAGPDDVARKLEEMQNALDRLTAEGEQWRNRSA